MSPLKRLIMVSLLLIALGALLVSTAAAEVCDVPTSCILYDANGTPSGYSLQIFPVDGKWPVPTADGKYQWIYEIKGPSSTLNQLTALAPVCCPSMGYSVLSGGQVMVPGGGDTSSAFGVGDYQDQVIRMAYSPSSAGQPANYSFLTDTLPEFRDNLSMQLKSGRNLYYCRAIAGPHCMNDCPVQDYIPYITYEVMMMGQFEVHVYRDRGTWCVQYLQYYDTRETVDGLPNPNYNTWVIKYPEPSGTIDGHTILNCGSADGNQKCQECILKSEGDNSYYIWLNGRRILVP